jgi:hypothetical protein
LNLSGILPASVFHASTLALATWLQDHPVGRVFVAPLDVVFTRVDIVEPDLLYVANKHADQWLNEKNVTGVDLAIEIASP